MKKNLWRGGRPEVPLGTPRPGQAPLRPGPPLTDRELPRVTVVILNYNGLHHLAGCFESLQALRYPQDRLEVVLVDNGSSDGSQTALAQRWPWVVTLANERNVGFSAGCNQGARAATQAQLLVFLNNDMRVEPDWLRELVAPVVRGEAIAATAKMLSWDGKHIDSAGGGMNFYGIGIQKGYRQVPGPEHDQPSRTLFACGGAMAVDARTFLEAGGFDEEFFAYYEDVDLGWRLWVRGHEIHYAPRAVCYHHHSSTSRRFPVETIRLLQVRNPLLACFKNYDDAHLRQILPAQLALFLRRMYVVSGLGDSRPYRIEQAEPRARGVVGRLFEKARHAGPESQAISRIAAADLLAANDLLGSFEHWSARRREVQAARRRPDEEIFALFHKPLWCIEDEAGYRQLQTGLVSFLGLDRLFAGLDGGGPEPHR
jgi:GT2 family glycosyltransferase